MIDRNAFWLPLVIAALLTVLGLWIDQAVRETVSPYGQNMQLPDFIIENFRASSTDEAGVSRYRLIASKMSHFLGQDLTLLEHPQFTHLHAKQGEIIVRSRLAWVTARGQEVVFTDNVSLHRLPSPGQGMLSVESQSLKVLPDQEWIISEQPVTISAPGLQVSAMALQLSGKTRILKLKGRVRARFQNASRA